VVGRSTIARLCMCFYDWADAFFHQQDAGCDVNLPNGPRGAASAHTAPFRRHINITCQKYFHIEIGEFKVGIILTRVLILPSFLFAETKVQ